VSREKEISCPGKAVDDIIAGEDAQLRPGRPGEAEVWFHGVWGNSSRGLSEMRRSGGVSSPTSRWIEESRCAGRSHQLET